nr:ATP synthase F0 subunit 8 [Rhabdoblattella disparis]
MPQMMPLSWISLYLFFSFMLLTFTFTNYFSYIPIPNSMNKKIIIKNINWKW